MPSLMVGRRSQVLRVRRYTALGVYPSVYLGLVERRGVFSTSGSLLLWESSRAIASKWSESAFNESDSSFGMDDEHWKATCKTVDQQSLAGRFAISMYHNFLIHSDTQSRTCEWPDNGQSVSGCFVLSENSVETNL